ncbi:hypothetical protein AGMMS50212_14650 [Spirochaetia bacterium]|nr:hypothetical protein AGMMS50212_14650 [Spirochaetia bacterium]
MRFKFLPLIAVTAFLLTCTNGFMDESLSRINGGEGGGGQSGSGRDIPSLGLFYINSDDDMRVKIQRISSDSRYTGKKLHFVLGCDINFSGSPLVDYDFTDPEAEEPTTDLFKFEHEFYGAGHTINTDTTIFAAANNALFDGIIVNANIGSHPSAPHEEEGEEEPEETVDPGDLGGSYLKNVGALVGHATGTKFSRIAVTGSINFALASDAGSDVSIGGIVGNTGGTIELSYFVGEIKIDGDANVGGISGKSSGTIEKCYTNGKIAASGTVGGISGDGGTINNSVSAMASVTGNRVLGSGSPGSTAYAFASMKGTGVGTDGADKTAEDLTGQSFWESLSFGTFYDPEDTAQKDNYDWVMKLFPVLKDYPEPGFTGLADDDSDDSE